MNLWNMVNPLTAPKKLGQVAVAPFQGSVNDKPWLQSTARTATGAMIGESPEATGSKFGDPPPSIPSASASGGGQGTPAFSAPGQGTAAGTTSQPISFGQRQSAQGAAINPQIQQAIGMFLGTLPPLVGIGGNRGTGSQPPSLTPPGGDVSGTGQLGGTLAPNGGGFGGGGYGGNLGGGPLDGDFPDLGGFNSGFQNPVLRPGETLGSTPVTQTPGLQYPGNARVEV